MRTSAGELVSGAPRVVAVIPARMNSSRFPGKPLAPLRYDLAVVHCEAARRTYAEEGCRMDHVLVHGRRSHHAPMPSGPLPERIAVGVFLCKDVNEEMLRALVGRLLAHPRVSRVLVRPHPKNLWRGLDEWVSARGDARLVRGGGSVFQDVETCDVVLGGNSSVMVEAVTAGRPAAFVPGIDHGPSDLHAFVARGLVPQYEEARGFDPDSLLRFYQRPNWPPRSASSQTLTTTRLH